jgi:hypothetical protein
LVGTTPAILAGKVPTMASGKRRKPGAAGQQPLPGELRCHSPSGETTPIPVTTMRGMACSY